MEMKSVFYNLGIVQPSTLKLARILIASISSIQVEAENAALIT